MEKPKKSYIYKIVNLINDKVYIGCTIHTIEKRFNDHLYRSRYHKYKSKLYNSINKYGIQNFEISLLEECNIDMMYIKEIEYIEKYDSYNNVLNNTTGGEGFLGYKHTQEDKNKMSKTLRENNNRSGKTYDEIYPEKSAEEKEKRKNGVKNHWGNLSKDEKIERTKKAKETHRKKSKYGIETIKEIRRLMELGLKNREIHIIFPEMRCDYLTKIRYYQVWKDL